MITQKQAIDISILRQKPQVQELWQRLDLQIIPTDAYRHGLAVQARVQELMNIFAKASSLPQDARSRHQMIQASACPQIFRSTASIKAWITQTGFSL